MALSRRELLERGSLLGIGGLVASALPAADRLAPGVDPALAAVAPQDATLQAFADTIVPGRRALRTDLGDEIHPDAIAGVDPEPGAVEGDALRLYRHPLAGIDKVAGTLLADLNGRALRQGAPFLSLPYARRESVVLEAIGSGPEEKTLYDLFAAVAMTAFVGAAVQPIATHRTASGYRVMGHPGAAPRGYRSFSYGRRFNRGRTRRGNLA
jgi:hypothetical protein